MDARAGTLFALSNALYNDVSWFDGDVAFRRESTENSNLRKHGEITVTCQIITVVIDCSLPHDSRHWQ